MTRLTRHASHRPKGRGVVLPAGHHAATAHTTLFPTRVFDASAVRLLKSGVNNRKIGRKVVKGKWAGMPIYTLTLEERATCSRSCDHWLDCYGNNMPFAQRIRASDHLMDKLDIEVAVLAKRHPQGFVVRLHVLGDFYNAEYVHRWQERMGRHPELHVFGYTAVPPESLEGVCIRQLNTKFPRRCRIRFSNWIKLASSGEIAVSSKAYIAAFPDAVTCPAQTGATDCCGTCGLCWTMDKVVRFLPH